MQAVWAGLAARIHQPERPALAKCLAERERHVERVRAASEKRARALADCEAQINEARAAVFAAHDGVVGARMGSLEKQWRRLAQLDPEQGVMDLWARVAPPQWIDQKRWRGNDVPADAAVALAADVDGVEAAEAAIDRLRGALAPWGVTIGRRVRWRMGGDHFAGIGDLLARPRAAAVAALSTYDRVPDSDDPSPIARAAYLDHLWRSARFTGPNPATPLHDLWKTGYVLSDVDELGVTLGFPALS